MRIGVFGGTFDPVHYGHLLLAEKCREQRSLDQIWFLPAWLPPHKQQRELTPAKQRVEMLELAIAGHPDFRVCTVELERGGVSYTVETLTALSEQHPQDEFYFLMGGDSLRDLPMWRQAEQICRLAVPVVVRRRDAPEPDYQLLTRLLPAERVDEIRQSQVEMPVIELSSTAIRQCVADNASIRFQTPRAVEKYIEVHALYRQESDQR